MTNKDILLKYAALMKEAGMVSYVDDLDNKYGPAKAINGTRNWLNNIFKTTNKDSWFSKALKNTGNFITNDILLGTIDDAYRAAKLTPRLIFGAGDLLTGKDNFNNISGKIADSASGALWTLPNLLTVGTLGTGAKMGFKLLAKPFSKAVKADKGILKGFKNSADAISKNTSLSQEAKQKALNKMYAKDFNNLQYSQNKIDTFTKMDPSTRSKFIESLTPEEKIAIHRQSMGNIPFKGNGMRAKNVADELGLNAWNRHSNYIRNYGTKAMLTGMIPQMVGGVTSIVNPEMGEPIMNFGNSMNNIVNYPMRMLDNYALKNVNSIGKNELMKGISDYSKAGGNTSQLSSLFKIKNRGTPQESVSWDLPRLKRFSEFLANKNGTSAMDELDNLKAIFSPSNKRPNHNFYQQRYWDQVGSYLPIPGMESYFGANKYSERINNLVQQMQSLNR